MVGNHLDFDSGYDFAMHMLKQMGKLSDSEIQAIDKQFNSMPKDANGNITVDNSAGNV
ncbi:hypothetical protein L195_g047678 [Trifolium pratense]|uniref:Uncharacterized protein n=1 Tax=Trifolium pratense TaxID=57577 RepID=A0A2K3ML57_TRIPR|nr:hypothetical protein L195_g047678 [Trifolium pratense]